MVAVTCLTKSRNIVPTNPCVVKCHEIRHTTSNHWLHKEYPIITESVYVLYSSDSHTIDFSYCHATSLLQQYTYHRAIFSFFTAQELWWSLNLNLCHRYLIFFLFSFNTVFHRKQIPYFIRHNLIIHWIANFYWIGSLVTQFWHSQIWLFTLSPCIVVETIYT